MSDLAILIKLMGQGDLKFNSYCQSIENSGWKLWWVGISLTAYKLLIRSHLEYCSTIWDPHYVKDITQLAQVQWCSARFVQHDYSHESSVTDMISDLGWETLQSKHKDAKLTPNKYALYLFMVHGRPSVCINHIEQTIYKLSKNALTFTVSSLTTEIPCPYKVKWHVPRLLLHIAHDDIWHIKSNRFSTHFASKIGLGHPWVV